MFLELISCKIATQMYLHRIGPLVLVLYKESVRKEE